MARKKKNGTKAQPELPGAERPSNAELDAVIGDMLAKRTKVEKARDKLKDAREIVLGKMRDARDALERDDHGNPTYVYRDGEQETAVKLSSAEKLITEVLVAGDAAGADAEAEAEEEF